MVPLLGAVPLLAARPAPLQDWPNHVARVHILVALLAGDPFWTQFYRFTGFLVPDAALDLGITGLLRAGLPLPLAAQCFLVATYGIFIGGFIALSRATAGSASDAAKPSLAVLLFYGNALLWGLVNYVLGLGLMLGLLAFWLRARRRPLLRLGVAGAGAAILLFTHLVVAVLWIIVLGCLELHRLLRGPGRGAARLLRCLSWLVALLTVAGLLHLFGGAGGQGFAVAYAGGRFGVAGHKLWLFAKLLLGGSRTQDAASLAALLVCAVAILRSRPRLAGGAAMAAAVLVLTTLLAPERIGAGSQLDSRLAIVPLLLLAASVRITPGRGWLWAIRLAVLARTLVLVGSFHASAQVFAQYRRQTSGLPTHGVMMMAYGTRLSSLGWARIWSPAVSSIATQSVLSHDLFMPAIFAEPGQQPIALRGRYEALKQPWNLSDPAHRRASAAALRGLCRTPGFGPMFLTVLYPGDVARAVGAALLRAAPDFLVLDACRLPD